MNENTEYTPDIYTLIDEEGKEQNFELLDILEEGEERYFAMIPYYDSDASEQLLDDDGDLIILKAQEVDGEEMMASIDDDAEYERIGQKFLDRLSNLFDEDFEE